MTSTKHIQALKALCDRTNAEFWQAPSRETRENHRRAVTAYEAASGQLYRANEPSGPEANPFTLATRAAGGFLRDESGAAHVETALLVAIVSAPTIWILFQVGDSLAELFHRLAALAGMATE